MKNFIIERRVNPFDILEKAQQSFEMLKKHVDNLLKGSEYMKRCGVWLC